MGANETDLAWFRFYGRRWLHGTMMLSPADRGIYIGVICLIVENGGPIEADEKAISRALGVDVRTWRASKNRLVKAGKLTLIENGSRELLTNIRAEVTAIEQRNYFDKQRDRACKRWSNRRKLNETRDATEDPAAYAAGYAITGHNNKNNPTLLSEHASSLASPCALGGASASEHHAKKRNQKKTRSNGHAPGARIEDVDPDHQARIAAWAVSRGMDVLTVSQADIRRARELGLLPAESASKTA